MASSNDALKEILNEIEFKLRVKSIQKTITKTKQILSSLDSPNIKPFYTKDDFKLKFQPIKYLDQIDLKAENPILENLKKEIESRLNMNKNRIFFKENELFLNCKSKP